MPSIRAAPMTLLGAFVASGYTITRRIELVCPTYAIVFLVQEKPVCIAGKAEAVTVGEVIICNELAYNRPVIEHELEHVRQFQKWGVLLPLLYHAAGFIAAVRNKSLLAWYTKNPFERV